MADERRGADDRSGSGAASARRRVARWLKDTATSSAVTPPVGHGAPAAVAVTPRAPAAQQAGTPGTPGSVTTTTTVQEGGTASGFPNWMLWLAIVLWAAACVAGTFGSSLSTLPRDAFFVSADGKSVDFCSQINPAEVARDPGVASQWCTVDQVIGAVLPPDVQTYTGGVQWESISPDDLIKVFGQPDLWLTLGVGLIALIFLTGFAKATGTLRAGLAAAISVVFLGLLLFPAAFTSQLPADMRSELVGAWQWVIAFYFGSEAAVQAFKVWKPEAAAVGGDTTAARGATTTTVTSTVTSTGP